jgi:prevent-host-death family protein
MAKSPAIVPVSDLRQDAARVLRNARNSKEPLFITQRGRATAFLLSLDAYERSEAEREVLFLLARGRRRSRQGSATPLTTSWLKPMHCSRAAESGRTSHALGVLIGDTNRPVFESSVQQVLLLHQFQVLQFDPSR